MSASLDPAGDLLRCLLALIDALCAALAEHAARETTGAPAALALTLLRSRLRAIADGIAATPASAGTGTAARHPSASGPTARPPCDRRASRANPMRAIAAAPSPQAASPPVPPARTRPRAPAFVFG